MGKGRSVEFKNVDMHREERPATLELMPEDKTFIAACRQWREDMQARRVDGAVRPAHLPGVKIKPKKEQDGSH